MSDPQAVQNHPDAGLLAAFAERALTPPERAALAVHLAVCARCRDVASWPSRRFRSSKPQPLSPPAARASACGSPWPPPVSRRSCSVSSRSRGSFISATHGAKLRSASCGVLPFWRPPARQPRRPLRPHRTLQLRPLRLRPNTAEPLIAHPSLRQFPAASSSAWRNFPLSALPRSPVNPRPHSPRLRHRRNHPPPQRHCARFRANKLGCSGRWWLASRQPRSPQASGSHFPQWSHLPVPRPVKRPCALPASRLRWPQPRAPRSSGERRRRGLTAALLPHPASRFRAAS